MNKHKIWHLGLNRFHDICLVFRGILKPENCGSGCEETDGAFAQKKPKSREELVSHFTATLVSSQTPYMYDRAKAHKSSDSRGHESELF